MRERSSMPADPNRPADTVVSDATGGPSKRRRRKNPAAVALGRRGGKKGGKARALKLSAARRREIATEAARARWTR